MFGDNDEKRLLHKILAILERAFAVTDFQLFQRTGDFVTMITGVQAGATGTFQIGFVPPNGVPLTSGPSVTVDDTLVTLGPVSTDGLFTFTAAVSATDVAASFNVTVSGVNGAGTPVSHTFNIPILAAPKPQITDFSLNQLS
jgi:hypothetical protein